MKEPALSPPKPPKPKAPIVEEPPQVHSPKPLAPEIPPAIKVDVESLLAKAKKGDVSAKAALGDYYEERDWDGK